MKKIPKILLSILLAGFGNTLFVLQNTSAMYQTEQSKWWTAKELIEFSTQAETELDTACGDDIGCREDLYFSRLESEDDRYAALDRIYESQFVITSINPTAGTIEAYFFDNDAMSRVIGLETHDKLNFIFFAWFDEINYAVGNYDYRLPIEPQFPDDIHLVYAKDSYYDGAFPANTYFTLQAMDAADLALNERGRLDLAIFADNYNAMGSMSYEGCLKAEDYTVGTECQLMVSGTYGATYWPPRETIVEESGPYQTTEPDPATDGDPSGSHLSTEPNSTVDPNDDDTSDFLDPATGDDDSTTSDDTIQDPNTDPSVIVNPNSDDPNQPNEMNGQSENLNDNSNDNSAIGQGSLGSDSNVATDDATKPREISRNPIAADTRLSITSSVNHTNNKASRASRSVNGITEITKNTNQSSEADITSREAVDSDTSSTNSPELVDLPLTNQRECTREIIFPWWFLVVLTLGDVIVMWLFWPDRNSHQKSHKNR